MHERWGQDKLQNSQDPVGNENAGEMQLKVLKGKAVFFPLRSFSMYFLKLLFNVIM